MKRFKFVAMICSFVFVALAITPRVKADEFNKKTILTFSEPVEVPGVGAQILPAGTYVFKLVDSLAIGISSKSSARMDCISTQPSSQFPITV